MSTPQLLYKILEHEPVHPLPESLSLSQLDINDGFVHLSIEKQIPDTSSKFFSHTCALWLLEIDSKKAVELYGYNFVWRDDDPSTGCVHMYARDRGTLPLLPKSIIARVLRWDKAKGVSWDQTYLEI